jgi:competence protein ComEA
MDIFLKYKVLFEKNQKVFKAVIIIVLILAALFLFLFRTGNGNEKEQDIIKPNETETQTSIQNEIANDIPTDVIIVDVAGEVQNPSVIELPVQSRINDAIEAAGGLTNQADISQINRAAVLSDGEKIFIPTKKDPAGPPTMPPNEGSISNNAASSGDGGNTLININYASSEELQKVPGIGPVTSEKIIQYRTEHGLFRKLDDIKKVSGIGDKTYVKMKPYICI